MPALSEESKALDLVATDLQVGKADCWLMQGRLLVAGSCPPAGGAWAGLACVMCKCPLLRCQPPPQPGCLSLQGGRHELHYRVWSNPTTGGGRHAAAGQGPHVC